MDIDNKTPQGVPCELYDDLGEVMAAEQECPGVWYIVADGKLTAEEYYIVERGTAYISDEAKARGCPLLHHPELLVYRIDDHRSGAGIVHYEVLRYLVRNSMPLPEGESLLAAAVFGMEDYPDYFGSWSAPRMTPRGLTTCWRELRPGVFFIETDQGKTLLAVCYPLWTSCLPEAIRRLAERTDFDRTHGIDNTFGYLFFSETAARLVLEELPDDNN